MTAAPAAAIVSVGHELLYGQTIDTNAAWLGAQLASLGVPVGRGFTVGDVAERIAGAVSTALEEADVVVVTGGLGPTADDITRETVAHLLGRRLVLDENRLRALEERFRARGLGALPATNERQALVPEGAAVLENPHGTAPGLALETGSAWVVLLPGVPREMRGIFSDGVRPFLIARLADRLRPVTHRLLHTTGVAESRLAQLIEEAIPPASLGDRVSIAYLPDLRGVDLRLSIAEAASAEADVELDRVEGILSPIVEPWRYRAASGDVAEAVLDSLRGPGLTLAVGESCTAGLVAARLTAHAGSSEVFLGGVVAYDNGVKSSLLGVDPAALREQGAVSETVARQMAEGAARATGADVAVGVTGVAGPGGGSPEKPVGTVWIAVTSPAGTIAKLRSFVGDRQAVRERAAQAALALVLKVVQREPVEP